MSDHSEPIRSTRDRAELHDRLETWLQSALPESTQVAVGALSSPDGSGMSSETLLFDATWTDAEGQHEAALVARVEPDPADIPIFPAYDLDLQYRVMQLVGETSSVPVPSPRWIEPDADHIGAPFFVMDRLSGRVPADIPPYTFEGWLFDATPVEQQMLQESSVGVLADLHAIDPVANETGFLVPPDPGDTMLRRHFEGQRKLYDWARRDRNHPILEAAFEWLDSNWPADSGPDVICWGDSRIGNIMYGEFTPVAVFDWEMATLGPRGLDVGWMTFMHTFFDEIARMLELPGLPNFMASDDVAVQYSARAGHTIENLDWYQTYAGLRHGIIMTRVNERQVHFGEAEWSDDVDAAIPHRDVLKQMIDGSWWQE
jgi:aminoglycoside phosphotransferase (APT) family kinase protein